MEKIKIFRGYVHDGIKLEEMVNEFIKDKSVISIQYQVHSVYDNFKGPGFPASVITYDSVMVEYEEPGGEANMPGYVWCDGEKLDFRG